MNDLAEVPEGAYVELDATLVDEGRMIVALSSAIKKALDELRAYHKATDSSAGKAKIKLDIVLEKQTDQFYGVSYACHDQIVR